MERSRSRGVQGACGPEAQQEGEAGVWLRKPRGPHHRAPAQAGEREAEGRNHRLRRTDQVVAGLAAGSALRTESDKGVPDAMRRVAPLRRAGPTQLDRWALGSAAHRFALRSIRGTASKRKAGSNSRPFSFHLACFGESRRSAG